MANCTVRCLLLAFASLIFCFRTRGDANEGQLQRKPHILFVLIDDLGWNDISWNNPTMITPNLESLARAGVILNQSYVQPICTPSRSALMSGYYPYRLGRQNTYLRQLEPTGLSLNVSLFPEELQNLGYSTHMIGKWHLGFCNWEYTPTYRGFDTFFGYYGGDEDYYMHSSDELDGTNADKYKNVTYYTKYLDLRNNTIPAPEFNGTYSAYLYTDVATDLISKLDPEKPAFIYLPFQSVHAPLQVPQKYIDMYKSIENVKRRTYCGMVTAMDEAVGLVVEAMKNAGLWENTLMIFSTDNGGDTGASGNNFPLRGNKGTIWEGGTRGPAFVYGAGIKKTGYVNENLFHIVDWYPTLVGLAGGSPEYVGDGIDQWKSISQNVSNVRAKFVYNIYDNGAAKRGAVRVGDYKLIVGDGGTPNGTYPPPPSQHAHRATSAFPVPINKYLKLFNVRSDPWELHEISSDNPKIVYSLWNEFLNRFQEMVPADDPADTDLGSPTRFGGVWSPGWCDIASPVIQSTVGRVNVLGFPGTNYFADASFAKIILDDAAIF